MSLVELRIEVPAYSHSFQIQVQAHWSIREIKEEIRRACPGAPQVDGQRVIWRGRILRDEERVSDIWKTPSDPRIVHLAVHPSAWTSSPGGPTPSPTVTSSEPQIPSASQAGPAFSTSVHSQPSSSVPLPFIVQKHNAALHVLTHGKLPSPPASPEAAWARSFAAGALYAHGWSWPSVLDEEYPLPTGSDGGVKYERVAVDNQPFLRLLTPNATPTPIQQHALKVLSHTFPLLSITTRDSAAPQPSLHNAPFAVTPTANLNQYLQQVGIPPMRLPNQPNPNPNDANNVVVAEIRVPLRALLMPLIMLTFRTFLLLYFFSPSKRPVFGIIFSLWILWETWGALRRVFGGNRPAVPPGQFARDANPGAAGQAANPQGQAAGAGTTPSENHGNFDFVINFFANMGLGSEDAMLDGALPAREPSPFRKAQRFITLMLVTLHPAVWDRRRNALRRREGRLRTEANIRESQPPADGDEETGRAQARTQAITKRERRQPWVRQYVERVETTEWAEDM